MFDPMDVVRAQRSAVARERRSINADPATRIRLRPGHQIIGDVSAEEIAFGLLDKDAARRAPGATLAPRAGWAGHHNARRDAQQEAENRSRGIPEHPNPYPPAITDAQLAAAHNSAERTGAAHGQAAGTWLIDGNTSDETKREILTMHDAGDPALWDLMPSPLSGEWADGYSTARCVRNALADAGVSPDHPDAEGAIANEILDTYEQAYSQAWEAEAVRSARANLPADDDDQGDTMAASFTDLLAHVGHALECVTYGTPVANVAIECVDCGMVLLDYDAPDDDE